MSEPSVNDESGVVIISLKTETEVMETEGTD